MTQRFIAAVAGYYYYVSGGTPHLASDCTAECPMNPVHASESSTTTAVEHWDTEEPDA